MRPLLCAIGFLTRLWVPAVDLSEQQLARSAGWFAWVGGLVAALLWVVARVLTPFDARLAALLVVAVWAFLTGGLHLDGVADSVDGLSGGRGQRERTLEIMRDSRIGSHGALALLLVLLLKWSALERLLGDGDVRWLLAPVLARFVCTLLMACFPYARSQGLGSAFAGRVGVRQVLLGGLALAAGLTWLGLPALIGALAGLLAGLLVAFRFQRLLGGLTGDVYGAAIEAAEGGCLLALALH